MVLEPNGYGRTHVQEYYGSSVHAHYPPTHSYTTAIYRKRTAAMTCTPLRRACMAPLIFEWGITRRNDPSAAQHPPGGACTLPPGTQNVGK